jgi:hypothetical protein
MRMTKREFDAAIDLIVQRDVWPDNDEFAARLVAAACAVIKQRQGVPDDAEWNAPPEPELLSMVRKFLADISPRQRKLLKQIAESLIMKSERLH